MTETAMPFPIFFSTEGTFPRRRNQNETAGAFISLFSPEKKRLYNFILKSLHYSEDADDVFQETVLRAFRYFDTFDPAKSFRPWIFTIASNEIKKHFKKKSFLNPMVRLEDLADKLPGEPDRELAEAVFSVATSLGVMEREIFFLFYDCGFSVAEISGISGKQEGNVKVILSNARKKIRKILEKNK